MYEQKLKELGITIPEAPKPLAAYLPAKRMHKLVFTAGQLPFVDGKLLFQGKLGVDVSDEDGIKCAKQSAINCLSAIKSVVGSIDNIESIIKVTVFVNSSETFTDHPKIANGASEFLVEVFGEEGKHARSAVGVAQLPMNAPVEIEMIVKLID